MQFPDHRKKEAKVITFLKNFGEKLNLETIVDEVGNVIIKKLASNSGRYEMQHSCFLKNDIALISIQINKNDCKENNYTTK